MINVHEKPKEYITKIEIPISDYYGDNVFFQCIYWAGSPTQEEVVKELEKRDKEAKEQLKEDFGFPYLGEWKEAAEMTKQVKEWRKVSPASTIMANTFVQHPKFLKQPYFWSIIEVVKSS